jgi:2-methylcitrate dehydratase PrpD
MLAAMPLTRRLVRLVLDECRARPVGELRRAAGRALFDFAACAEAGRPAVAEFEPAGEPALSAAAAHVLDRDDLHWPSLTHPGSIVWPVVLALPPEQRLLAAAAGYETTARLALALGAPHRRHWHVTSTAGTVGAAVAAAVALGLDEHGVTRAAGHAISVAGGSIQCVLERSRTIVFHRAHAAATGLAAARAAAAGLGATRDGLEAERGFFAASAPGSDPASVLAPRERLAIEELTFRFYAATGFAHAAIDAALELAPVDPNAVSSIEVRLAAAAAALAGGLEPRDALEAWWSAPLAVAAALLGRDPTEPPSPDDPALRPLIAKTRVVAHDEPSSTVAVDGRTATRLTHKGHHEDPLSEEELVAKWRLLNPGLEPQLNLLELR